MKLEKDTLVSHYKILSEIGKGGTFFVPTGLIDNSPVINRRVPVKNGFSPIGTDDRAIAQPS